MAWALYMDGGFVASFTGAWIETDGEYEKTDGNTSRILYGCVD